MPLGDTRSVRSHDVTSWQTRQCPAISDTAQRAILSKAQTLVNSARSALPIVGMG